MFILPWIVYIMAFALQMVVSVPNSVTQISSTVSAIETTSSSYKATTLAPLLETPRIVAKHANNSTNFTNSTRNSTGTTFENKWSVLDIPSEIVDFFRTIFAKSS